VTGWEVAKVHVDPMRVRRPSRGFGWIDHRVLSGGHLATLDCSQIATYFTLCLVADRHGISFYRAESLARIIKRPASVVSRALVELRDRGLIACDGRYVQVRDLDEIARAEAPTAIPTARAVSPASLPEPPAEAPDVVLARLAPEEREQLLKRVRQRFERFLGRREPSRGVLLAAAVALLREGQR
jgi:hypothetical protein